MEKEVPLPRNGPFYTNKKGIICIKMKIFSKGNMIYYYIQVFSVITYIFHFTQVVQYYRHAKLYSDKVIFIQFYKEKALYHRYFNRLHS
jgi:hypothetical protein